MVLLQNKAYVPALQETHIKGVESTARGNSLVTQLVRKVVMEFL